MTKCLNIFSTVIIFIFALITIGLCQENLTITTYYPSPNASYRQIFIEGAVSGSSTPGIFFRQTTGTTAPTTASWVIRQEGTTKLVISNSPAVATTSTTPGSGVAIILDSSNNSITLVGRIVRFNPTGEYDDDTNFGSSFCTDVIDGNTHATHNHLP